MHTPLRPGLPQNLCSVIHLSNVNPAVLGSGGGGDQARGGDYLSSQALDCATHPGVWKSDFDRGKLGVIIQM